MPFGAGDWDGVLDALRNASEVAIACHVNPDGDALGSLLGASLALRKLGKTTYPTWDAHPARVPDSLKFLPGAGSILQPGDVPEVGTWLAVDCGAGDRLGSLEKQARAAARSINIDHHPGNDMFATLNVVVPEASSTSELIAFLLNDLPVELDADIATCLYTGIVTDTGRFQYSNATPDTLRLAADLLSYGVSAPDIAREVFESAPFGSLKLLGRVLDRARLFEDERFLYSWLERGDLEETGVAPDETDQLIERIGAVGAADVVAMFKEQPDGKWRVSLRSKGRHSVGAIARARGGGGHELAAGFSTPDRDGTVEDIRRVLRG